MGVRSGLFAMKSRWKIALRVNTAAIDNQVLNQTHLSRPPNDNTGQQNLTFSFGTRGKISNPNSTFNAEFKCVSSFSPSPTVCL